ncbi:hypothetical protein SB912_29535, partial [Pantoea sp. SIMBA_072]
MGLITMNFAANGLGLDNAATPIGLKAMRALQELNPSSTTASNAQILADTANPAYVGSRFPRIPRMRANLLASYRFD